MTYGENVAIFVKEMTPGPRTRVEVVSKKAIELNVFGNWANELLDRLGEKLAVQGTRPAIAIDDVDAVPLDARGKQGYRDWLTRKTPRACVIAEGGAWNASWGASSPNPDDPVDPTARAMQNCQKRGKTKCKLYAVDYRVVWVPE